MKALALKLLKSFIDHGPAVAVSIILGIMIHVADIRGDAYAASAKRVKELEGNLRGEVGKRLKMEEEVQEQVEAAESAKAMELYPAHSALAACKEAKK